MNGKSHNLFSLLFVVGLSMSALTVDAQDVMRKQADGTYVVNTTTLCKNVHGFKKNGTTPVEVYISKGKVIKVVALPNQESPGYFAKVKKALLPLFTGIKVSKAKKVSEQTQVDGCTGATYSTRAVQKNIKAALAYYEKNK